MADGRGWVLDLDGVVWLADEAIAGSAGAIDGCGTAGHDVVFVSNNSSVPVAAVEDKLASFAIPARGQVVTSAVVAAELVDADRGGPALRRPRGRGRARRPRRDDGAGRPRRRRDGRLPPRVRLRPADDARRRRSGAAPAWWPPTTTPPTRPPTGRSPAPAPSWPRSSRATGATPVVAGKPNRPMVEHLRRRLGPDGIMVGDRPDTDGRFAVALGYDFGLVLSGVTRPATSPSSPPPPSSPTTSPASWTSRSPGTDGYDRRCCRPGTDAGRPAQARPSAARLGSPSVPARATFPAPGGVPRPTDAASMPNWSGEDWPRRATRRGRWWTRARCWSAGRPPPRSTAWSPPASRCG